MKAPLSLHLSGGSYVGYDLSQIGGSNQPILADREHLHLEFRTAADSGLLFYTGKCLTNNLADVWVDEAIFFVFEKLLLLARTIFLNELNTSL